MGFGWSAVRGVETVVEWVRGWGAGPKPGGAARAGGVGDGATLRTSIVKEPLSRVHELKVPFETYSLPLRRSVTTRYNEAEASGRPEGRRW